MKVVGSSLQTGYVFPITIPHRIRNSLTDGVAGSAMPAPVNSDHISRYARWYWCHSLFLGRVFILLLLIFYYYSLLTTL